METDLNFNIKLCFDIVLFYTGFYNLTNLSYCKTKKLIMTIIIPRKIYSQVLFMKIIGQVLHITVIESMIRNWVFLCHC